MNYFFRRRAFWRLKAEELCLFSSCSNACENSSLEVNHNAKSGIFFLIFPETDEFPQFNSNQDEP